MKFLIIGGSGFIGRHVLAAAKMRGYEAVGTASRFQSNQSMIGLDLKHDRLMEKVPVSFFETDGPVFVLVAAGISKIDDCFRMPEETRRINVTNTIRLMEDAASAGARIVCLSSSAVFNGKCGDYTENASPSPINEYGRQKADVEAYCREARPEWLVARLDKVVGDDPNELHLFSEWHALAKAGKPIDCISGQFFSPTLVDDIAAALILACNRKLTGIFNMSTSECFARDDLARMFLSITGYNVPVVQKTQQDMDLADARSERTCLNSSKFIDATGMRFVSMREVISRFSAGVSSKSKGLDKDKRV